MKDFSLPLLKTLALAGFVAAASAPWPIVATLFGSFCLPALFMTLGYTYESGDAEFRQTSIVQLLRRFYLPLLTWGFFFLIFHNLFLSSGIIGEMQADRLTWSSFAQGLWDTVSGLPAAPSPLSRTLWVLRAALIASLVWLLLYKSLSRLSYFKNRAEVGWVIFSLCCILLLWHALTGVGLSALPEGGYRELLALLFFSMGFEMKQYRASLPISWKTWPIYALFLYLSAAYFPADLNAGAALPTLWPLPLTSAVGFLLLLGVADLAGKSKSRIAERMSALSRYTRCVIVFAPLGFKAVGALHLAALSMPWSAICSAPLTFESSFYGVFTLLYLVAGLGLPAFASRSYHSFSNRHQLGFEKRIEWSYIALKWLVVNTVRLIAALIRWMRDFCKSLWQWLKEFLSAANPRNE